MKVAVGANIVSGDSCPNNSNNSRNACLWCCHVSSHHRRGVPNQVQLSTYPDCIGSDLTDLRDFLDTHVDGERVGSMGLLFKGCTAAS